MTKGGKLTEGLFAGETINTPSMLAVEDALDGLAGRSGIGGADALIARATANLAAIEGWVAATPWVDFLAREKRIRSRTSVCLDDRRSLVHPARRADRAAVAKQLVQLVEAAGAGYDLGAYRDAPPGLRLWAGATVETADLEALFPWLDWAWASVKAERRAA